MTIWLQIYGGKNMKKTNLGVVFGLVLPLASCSMMKSRPTENQKVSNNQVQTESRDREAFEKAANLTGGWPESSVNAAKEIISKYGEPSERTTDSLIWRNIAPFKKIVVHKEVYSHRFPLLHQNSLEHVVDYRAPVSKIDDVWQYNGSIVLDRTKGEMSSFAENESMNILALNLAHQVMTGKMGHEVARVTYGKETMNYLNGKKTANTTVLNFGNQFQTADQGESITNKIQWVGDPALQKKGPTQTQRIKQAQEEN